MKEFCFPKFFFYLLVASFALAIAGCGGSGSGSKPQTPANVTAMAGNGQVTLVWSAVTGAASYNVYRSTTSGGEANAKPVSGIIDTGFVDVDLTNGTKYFYEVAAVSSGGATSALSQEVSTTPQVPPVPAAPVNLTATSGNQQIALSWSAVSDATYYNVYRGSTSGGEPVTPLATGITATSYTDTGLTNGLMYYYEVAAVNPGSGMSSLSDEVIGVPRIPTASPANLAATAGNARVVLTWSAIPGAASYNIYIGTQSGGESSTPIATEITATSYADTAGIANGTTYYYVLGAVNSGSEVSGYSNEAGATPTSTLPPTATRANDFLNTMGVNTQIGQGLDDATKVASLVNQIGIRNIRDEDNPSSVSDFLSVNKQTGAKFVLTYNGPDDTELTNMINDSQQLANAGALLALEGPNQPGTYITYNVTWDGQTSSGTDWTPIANWQSALYSQSKNNPVLAKYPVFETSNIWLEPNNVGLQFLTIPVGAGTLMPDGTQYADYAGEHNYIGGYQNCTPPLPNQEWIAESPTENNSCLWQIYNDHGVVWQGGFAGYSNSQLQTLPKVTTETGYPEGYGGISDDQIGRIYLNLFLDATLEGWSYTFLYDMVDEGDGFGLVNSDYSLRTQATYLQNFTTILADTSSNFAPGTLNYSIPDEPATVHDLLLQKSNGTLYIAVWDEETPGSGATDAVTVDLGGAYNVAEFDPTTGTTPVTTFTGVSSVPLTLSDHPVILQLN